MRASAPHSPRRPWGYETQTPFHRPAPRARSRRRNRAGGGANRAPALAPAPDRPTPRPGAGASLRARLGMGALLLIDRSSTRSGSGRRNPKRTLSSSVGVRGARATFATAVPGCGWRGRINCHRPVYSARITIVAWERTRTYNKCFRAEAGHGWRPRAERGDYRVG